MTQVKSTDEEVDVETLQRQYRNMEINRKAYADESAIVLRKQQVTLDKLRKENESLKMDIASLQARTTMKPINPCEQKQMDHLMKDIEQFNLQIATEKNHILQTEEEAAKCREEIWNQRKAMGGSFASVENQRSVEKQVRVIMNRLDQALVKFNKSLAYNRKLRQEIDDLRGERVSFDRVHAKFEKSLEDRKKQMAQLIEQSNLIYEQRDKTRAEIISIAQTDKKEQDQFDQQMKELGDELENEIRLASERRAKTSGTSSADEETIIATDRKVTKANALWKEKEAIALERKKIADTLEGALRRITATTGMSDIDELVNHFLANEEKNFSLLNNANDQAYEIEKINAEIQMIREEECRYTSENGDESLKHVETMKETEEKILDCNRQCATLETKYNENVLLLDTFSKDIGALITRLDFHDGDKSEISINETSLLEYLANIESKTNDILSKYMKIGVWDKASRRLTEQHGSDSNYAPSTPTVLLGEGPNAPMGNDPIYINPPRSTEYSSDENSGEEASANTFRPLSYKELMSKTATRMLQHAQRRRSKVALARRGSIIRNM